MKNIIKVALLIAFSFCLSFNTLSAQEHEKESQHNESAHSHHPHKHHVALFNGATSNLDHETTAYTIGLDYEYRFSKIVGATLLGEYVATSSSEILAGAGLLFHPYRGLKVVTAPMVLFAEEHNEEHHNTSIEKQDKKATFAFRFSAAYDFYIGNLSLGPVINYDLGETNSISYGVAVGIGF